MIENVQEFARLRHGNSLSPAAREAGLSPMSHRRQKPLMCDISQTVEERKGCFEMCSYNGQCDRALWRLGVFVCGRGVRSIPIAGGLDRVSQLLICANQLGHAQTWQLATVTASRLPSSLGSFVVINRRE